MIHIEGERMDELKAKLSKTSPEPLYIQVQNYIKDKIAAGEWKPKEKLPAETNLADALEISRGTIKQAIKQLVNEGVLMQIHGKGTFVVGEQLEYPLGERLISVAETMIENQRNFKTRLISLERVPANKLNQDTFNLKLEEEVYTMQRIRFFEGNPVVFLENHLPAKLFPKLEEHDFEASTLFSVIENNYNTVIEWGKRTFLAKGAEEDIANRLEIKKGTPITLLEQTIYTSNNSPIEYSRVWIRNDQIKLTSILKRNPM